MNKLKIYLRTKGNIQEQANTYAEAFNGKVLKNSLLNTFDVKNNDQDKKEEIYNFAYVELVNDVNILIAFHKNSMPSWGYQSDIVLTIQDREEFENIYANLTMHPDFSVGYEKTAYKFGGGVILAKFIDKWGYGWILETKAQKIKA